MAGVRGIGKRVSQFLVLERAMWRTPARHMHASILVSAHDEVWQPSKRLIDLSIAVARRASEIGIPDLDERPAVETRWYQLWPGEHYRLLAALVHELNAKTVIEIGTYMGMGTLSIASALPVGGKVATFDIVPWDKFEKTWFSKKDFSDGRIEQHIADVSTPEGMEPFRDLFAKADLIFADGPKDWVMEQRLIKMLGSMDLSNNPIVMFDDIRLPNMIDIWRRLARPKMDLTSFGHWSGTGLVDWNGRKPA